MKSSSLLLLFLCFLMACQPSEKYPKVEDPLAHLYDQQLKPFYYGVASGDPTASAVVIWTKLVPEDSLPEALVTWRMSADQSFDDVLQSGEIVVTPASGYTAKIDLQNLNEGETYFYQFEYKGQPSLVGRTKTAKSTTDVPLNFAVVSCSNYEFGPFNAYGAIAEREDIDAVIHLGDYIYEYGAKGYGDTTTGRFHLPEHEILSIEDYRTRYGQYRLDQDLQEVHQMHPFFTIWDDHEIANNAFKDGAENHQEDEGDYMTRKEIARKVYYEWLPIREQKQLYRTIQYGDLAELILLDERYVGRTEPVNNLEDPDIENEERTMLGEEQLDWFLAELKGSKAQWKIIGNQVIFSYLNWGYPTFNFNMDSWDGYPLEREIILKTIAQENIKDIVFITGDTHSSWALEVTADPTQEYAQKGAYAVEYGTTSVNSGNTNERGIADEVIIAHEDKITNSEINPHLKYANLRDHGYLLLSLSENAAVAEWYYTPSRVVPSRAMVMAKRAITPAGSNRVLIDK